MIVPGFRAIVHSEMSRIAILLIAFPVLALAQSWKPLFDGKTMIGWKETPFTEHGVVKVENGAIVLNNGKPLTGVNYTGAFPKIDYEIQFEAARIDGNDFFACLTLPFGDSFFSLVTGGWGGDIVGISSIGGWDASDNETRTYFNFDRGRWFRFRLEVTAERIRTWIDDQKIIDVLIAGRPVSLRQGEIKLSAPVGFASYSTIGSIRKIEYRLLPVKNTKR
jgi:hypothetical protein